MTEKKKKTHIVDPGKNLQPANQLIDIKVGLLTAVRGHPERGCCCDRC